MLVAKPVAPDDQPAQKFSQGSAPEFAVADPASVSISVDLRKRLPTDRLALDVQDALLSIDISAKPLKPTPGFASPGDDDFSFADGDGLGERLNTGYPGLNIPLVLVTVAERGPYVIAAAHVFSPDGRGSGKLKRIARYVVGSAEANESHVKAWPDCFANAVMRFKEKPEAEADDSCAKLTLKGAVDPGSGKAAATAQPSPPSADVPSVATPAQTAQPTQPVPGAVQAAPGQRKAQGMLDDVEVTRDKVVVIIPPDAPSKGGGFTKPAARPEPAPKATAQPEPANTAVLPELAPKAPAPPPSDPITSLLKQSPPVNPVPSSSAKSSPPRFQLMEQLIAYGLVWTPRESTKIFNLASGMANRSDDVGQCLGRNGMAKEEIAIGIQHDLALDRSKLTKLPLSKGEEYYELTADLSDRSAPELANYCINSPPLIRPFRYFVRPWRKKLSLSEVQAEVDDLIQVDIDEASKVSRKDRFPPREWRLPTAIEAFAIASVFTKEKTEPLTFWTFHNKTSGMLSIDKINGRFEVDHVQNPPPNTKASFLITVHN